MVPEKEASGEFDYLWEAADESGVAEDDPQESDGFDAFDENTWDEDFTPVSTTPWYRSAQSRTLMIASATALSAIVISLVLLVFRDSSAGEESAPVESTTAVTTPLASTTSERPAPPPPPPPPPPPEPSAVNEAPAVPRPSVRPRQTKKPEIGVTRTPATRQPISVAPQPRGPR
jgi:hypothetical protein